LFHVAQPNIASSQLEVNQIWLRRNLLGLHNHRHSQRSQYHSGRSSDFPALLAAFPSLVNKLIRPVFQRFDDDTNFQFHQILDSGKQKLKGFPVSASKQIKTGGITAAGPRRHNRLPF
jgi:hypothetical protein